MKHTLWFVGSVFVAATLVLASCGGAGAAPAAPPTPTPCARIGINLFGQAIGAIEKFGADCPPTPAPMATVAPTATPLPTATLAPTQPMIVQNITITGNNCSVIQIGALGNTQSAEVRCSTVNGPVPPAVATKAPPRPTVATTATPECTPTPACDCE